MARDRSEDEIARWIGADSVVYQNLDDLIAAVGEDRPEVALLPLVVGSPGVDGEVAVGALGLAEGNVDVEAEGALGAQGRAAQNAAGAAGLARQAGRREVVGDAALLLVRGGVQQP